jgi:RimJ/RimL family protein N-acetyltransferase
MEPMSTTATQTVAVTPVAKPPAHTTVEVIPYNGHGDPQALDFLPWLWRKMQEDDLVDYYFPGQKDTGFCTFVRMMSGDASVGIIKRNIASDQWRDLIAGFISYTPMRLGHASVAVAGFIFFKEFWDHHTTDEAGRVAFEFWFTQTDHTMVLGVCPSDHLVAIRYNKRVGLREVGRLPNAHLFKGNVCDAILFAMTKDEWLARQGGV